ncbi:MAG: metallophosphoesterase family protein [Candidatus Woesearchaeota archaeon]|nr:metallophosphoesterase family protein [Candidatus Woesearchaeota archaeon]
MAYEQLSTEQLVSKCIERDILVPPEALNDKERILALLQSRRTVEILENYTKAPKKYTVQDFVKHFSKRYRAINAILRQRKELENATSIARVLQQRERAQVSFIGMIVTIKETKSKHLIVTVEDPTGQVDVWLHADNKQFIETRKELVPDEVIGISGSTAGRRVFANNIIFPDVPITKELKKGQEEVYVGFVGDVEVGSKLFMKEAFENMILWLSGKVGTEEQRTTAKKIGYLVFIGDLVHGVGVYPRQEEDSNIHDIKAQYDAFAKLVKMIPENIQLIMIAGNHDAGRLQEPQLPLYTDIAEELYKLPNVTIVSNPATVTIEKRGDHPGFDLLLYHGYSLVHFANNVQAIKDAGGMDAMDEVMKLYLKKRHIAPTHGSNTYVPDSEKDPMVIETVPDFIVTGHTHNISYGNYNGVTLVNPGCWNDVSDEQIKRGLIPEPAKLPIVNLRTREMRLINFYPEEQ